MSKCGRPKGFRHSLKTRRKMSIAQRKRKQPEEVKQKIRMALMGNTNSLGVKRKPETIEKHRRFNTGQFYVGRSSPRKGKKYPQYSGKNSSQWKGGITPLHDAIRLSLENREWKLKVFERDNYACRECGNNKSGALEAHHIKPFTLILKEFIQTYSQFSPIEDKETLVRLAITYQPFWDLGNGKTLCNDCHNLTRREVRKWQT